MTEEQNAAIVQAQVDAHFGPKPAPPPKEKVPEKTIDHFIRMARAPAPKPVDTDYERHIKKLNRARLQKEASSSSSKSAGKRSGKTVPQLGEQAAQSIPPLVVPTTHESRRAQYYCGQTVNVPGLGDVVITEEHIEQAKSLMITIGQLLDIEPMSPLREEEIKRKYVRGQPLVEPRRSRTSQRECMNCMIGT